MMKFNMLIQRVIAVFACWGVLGGIALSQAQQGDDAPQHNPHGPACWPAPCVASEDPDAKHLFGNYFIPPRTEWYSEFDIVAIQANAQAATTLLTYGTTGVSALSTGNFGWDMQMGGKAIVGCTIDECWQLEGQYMEIATSNNNASVRSTTTPTGAVGNLQTPFGNFGAAPITGVDNNFFGSVHYTDSMQNGELILRRQMPTAPGRLTMSVLCGVRYTGVREEMEFDTLSNAPAPVGAANNYHVHTDNEMVGGELGALFEFYIENRWWLDFEFKGIIYNNQAKVITNYTFVTGTGTGAFTNTDQETHTSYAEDLTVSMVYRWSPHVATRLGYQAIIMQDVALAPENLPTNSTIQFGPVEVNHNQTMIYQGPVAGLLIAW
jgi:hypothetical protein